MTFRVKFAIINPLNPDLPNSIRIFFMKKQFLVLALIVLLNFFNQTVQANQEVENLGIEQVQYKQLDKQAKILAQYLAKHNSPLQYHAQDFIDAAKVYDLDWKLVASIAGVESTFGKFIPGGYNGWGWGVYGSQAIYFSSWKDGIYTVSKGLRENYLDKGYTDPYSMNKIYAASPFWGIKVSFFMKELEEFASQFETQNPDLLVHHSPKIAAVSASLVLK